MTAQIDVDCKMVVCTLQIWLLNGPARHIESPETIDVSVLCQNSTSYVPCAHSVTEYGMARSWSQRNSKVTSLRWFFELMAELRWLFESENNRGIKKPACDH